MGIFTRTNFIDFVEKVFGARHIDGRGENIQVVCPLCKQKKGDDYNRKKLSIKLDQIHICRCWVCSFSSANLLYLIKKFHPSYTQEYISNFLSSEYLSRLDDESGVYEEELKIPSDFRLLVELDKQKHYPYFSYLKKRGLNTTSDLWYWKFGISKQPDYINRVIVPSFDMNGELNYFTARAIKPWFKPKYYNPEIHRKSIVFNELNINWKQPLIITEGPFDVMKCSSNATALLGSELDEEYKLFHNIIYYSTPVYIALDADAKHKSLRIASLLMQYDIPVKIVTLKGEEDVGSLSKTQVQRYLEAASKPFSDDDILREKISSISL